MHDLKSYYQQIKHENPKNNLTIHKTLNFFKLHAWKLLHMNDVPMNALYTHEHINLLV